MELFYSPNAASGIYVLDPDESNHCVRVLRHRKGDAISVIDGAGTLYECEIIDDNPKCVGFRVMETTRNFAAHPYRLHVAVAPPKNIDRFEWFAEKATEMGIDCITPIFGECSERKVFKGERSQRIIVSAVKQSLKAAVPVLEAACTAKEFIGAHRGDDALKFICYCDDTSAFGVEKRPLVEYLASCRGKRIIVMIGPEGDFSSSEVQSALECGFLPVSLGESRLRIETAALTATAAVYLASQR